VIPISCRGGPYDDDTEPELLDELLSDYETPEDLLGDEGLFKQLKKALLERALPSGVGGGMNTPRTPYLLRGVERRPVAMGRAALARAARAIGAARAGRGAARARQGELGAKAGVEVNRGMK